MKKCLLSVVVLTLLLCSCGTSKKLQSSKSQSNQPPIQLTAKHLSQLVGNKEWKVTEFISDTLINFRAAGEIARNDNKYNELVSRFEANDTTLVADDVFVIYYGRAYRPDYAGSSFEWLKISTSIQKDIISMKSSNSEQILKRAFDKGLEYLKKDPTNLQALKIMIDITSMSNVPQNVVDSFVMRYLQIVFTILQTGGGTEVAPIWVTDVSDEYDLLFGFIKAETLLGRETIPQNNLYCDKMKIRLDNGQILDIYFNVYFSMMGMGQSVTTKTERTIYGNKQIIGSYKL